ncbi:MAG: hypothetical protein ACFFCY_12745 [Promethearchaeota archaeon]
MKFKKNKISILALIFALMFSSINPRIKCDESSWIQIWTKDMDYASDIAIDSNDTLYIVGHVEKDNDQDICLLKYNKSGGLIWVQIWDINDTEYRGHLSIVIDKSDNLYIARNKGLIKCDSNGNILWNVTFSAFTLSKYRYSIKIDSLDNIYIASYTDDYGIFIAKFDSSGSQLGNFTWGTSEPIEYVDITIDDFDNLYVLAKAPYSLASYLVKLNSLCIELWNISIIGYDSIPLSLAADSENNIFSVFSDKLIKINSSGQILWTISNTFTGCDELSIDSYGNVYCVGEHLSKGPCIDYTLFDGIRAYMSCTAIFIIKYNNSGEFLWEKLCTSCSSASAAGVVFDTLNNLYLCGTLIIDRSGAYRWDIILFKNPSNVSGACICIYYDVIALIVILIIMAITIPIYLNFKKRKLKKEK